MDITVLGFGSWAIGGGDWLYGWGKQDDDESIRTIHAALDTGINWIDTAVTYGGGHSEEIVGRALKGRAEKPFVFTKCGIVWDKDNNVTKNLSADSLRLQVEGSLRRLGVDTIDLYQIHWPDTDEQNLEGWRALGELRKEGKVRHIGVSNFSVEQMTMLGEIEPIASNQIPYSLITADAARDIMPYCRENGIGILNYSPMAGGLLSGKMTRERYASLPQNDLRRDNANYHEPKFGKNLELVALLGEIAERNGVTMAQAAIAWTLMNPASTGTIVGMRKVDQVAEICRAAEVRIPDEDMRKIDSYCSAEIW